MSRGRDRAVLTGTVLFFLVVLLACPFLGPTHLSLGKVFGNQSLLPGDQDARIFFQVRLPRNLLAGLAGAAMACAGLAFQAVLRNALACPFTLGVAGGSSFGAVVVILLGWTSSSWGPSWIGLSSFLGALVSLLLLYCLSSFLRNSSALSLLLAGIGINYFFNALVLLSYYLADFTQSYAMIHWMIGSLDLVGLSTVWDLGLVVGVSFLVLWAFSRDLDLLASGEELAQSKGVPAKTVTWTVLGAASLMTSAVVSLTGPIAFVGLIVPHLYRLGMGSGHRWLFPACLFGGASFLMLCDTAARSFFGPSELPVGVLTALLGVPMLLWLLLKGGR